jgi:hypothetical protein|tara:strand:+ start:588 stop:938 length:351 start_codon:yes stop_codon:yes gene_type:complete
MNQWHPLRFDKDFISSELTRTRKRYGESKAAYDSLERQKKRIEAKLYLEFRQAEKCTVEDAKMRARTHVEYAEVDRLLDGAELQTESAYADYEGLRLKCQLLIQENSTQKQEMKLG